MAVLTDPRRIEAWREIMAELSQAREGTGVLTKADLRAALDAIDNFLNTNASALNTAIPQPARGVLTAAQKARMLLAVVRYRYIDGA